MRFLIITNKNGLFQFCPSGGRAGLLLGLCLSLSLAGGCGLRPTDPAKLFDNAVSGLSAKDSFVFDGQTQLSLNGLPPQQGIAFKGTVTGHNQLSMQVVPIDQGAGTAKVQPMNAGKTRTGNDVTVQLSRTKDKWIVSESPPAGEAEQLIRWNPLSHLERLNVMNKQVATEKGAAVQGMSVLTIHPDSTEVSAMLQADLTSQLQSLDTDRKLKELQQKLQLSDKQTAAMRGEVEKSLADARKKIEEMKGSLKAESTYRLGVDRKSNLPKTMQVVTDMHYISDGKPKDESTDVKYTFGG
jgi:hypothetical protein